MFQPTGVLSCEAKDFTSNPAPSAFPKLVVKQSATTPTNRTSLDQLALLSEFKLSQNTSDPNYETSGLGLLRPTNSQFIRDGPSLDLLTLVVKVQSGAAADQEPFFIDYQDLSLADDKHTFIFDDQSSLDDEDQEFSHLSFVDLDLWAGSVPGISIFSPEYDAGPISSDQDFDKELGIPIQRFPLIVEGVPPLFAADTDSTDASSGSYHTPDSVEDDLSGSSEVNEQATDSTNGSTYLPEHEKTSGTFEPVCPTIDGNPYSPPATPDGFESASASYSLPIELSSSELSSDLETNISIPTRREPSTPIRSPELTIDPILVSYDRDPVFIEDPLPYGLNPIQEYLMSAGISQDFQPALAQSNLPVPADDSVETQIREQVEAKQDAALAARISLDPTASHASKRRQVANESNRVCCKRFKSGEPFIRFHQTAVPPFYHNMCPEAGLASFQEIHSRRVLRSIVMSTILDPNDWPPEITEDSFLRMPSLKEVDRLRNCKFEWCGKLRPRPDLIDGCTPKTSERKDFMEFVTEVADPTQTWEMEYSGRFFNITEEYKFIFDLVKHLARGYAFNLEHTRPTDEQLASRKVSRQEFDSIVQLTWVDGIEGKLRVIMNPAASFTKYKYTYNKDDQGNEYHWKVARPSNRRFAFIQIFNDACGHAREIKLIPKPYGSDVVTKVADILWKMNSGSTQAIMQSIGEEITALHYLLHPDYSYNPAKKNCGKSFSNLPSTSTSTSGNIILA
ncbi:uncharacterized protein V1516DRAFT_693679 [Lipomyces oligophaga]|uniref:uncharacterized protein n=1 Tax=Lipomyces oligophaga TaxID=45792 RepID=UPI0034CE90F5